MKYKLILILLILSVGTFYTVSASPWNVTINALNHLEPVTFGYHPNANDTYDNFDEFTQIPQMGKVIMALDKTYATSIKRNNLTWNLSVSVPIGTTTTLSWNVSNVPDNVVLTLGNETLDVDMKTQNSLNLSGGSHRFTISVTLKVEKSNLNITNISVNTSNNTKSTDGEGNELITETVAEDIKSEKIRRFVYETELITGSEIDINLSAKYLKTDVKLVTTPLEINKDCILVGGPVANPTVKKYLENFPIKVTNEYPGKHKGVIEKITINGYIVVLLAGSDRWGTKAAVEYFKTLDNLPDEPIFVEWKNGSVVRIEKP